MEKKNSLEWIYAAQYFYIHFCVPEPSKVKKKKVKARESV